MNQLSNKERVNSEGISISRFRHCNIGNSLKIEHWKLNIGLSALLFFLWCTQASAATFGVPSNYLTLGQGLVGHWTFDGKDVNWATGAVKDRSGNGIAGYMLGMSTSTNAVKGKIGQALMFDGGSTRVTMGDTLNITGALTISAWVYNDGNGLNKFVAGRGQVGGGAVATSQYRLEFGNSQVARMVLSNGTSFLNTGNTSNSAPINTWTHWAGTYDGVDTAYFYINGVLDDTETSAGFGALNASTLGFTVGDRESDSTGTLNGNVDDLRVYNRTLRADEIKTLYNSGAVALGVSRSTNPADSLSQGLVGHWTMDGPDLIRNVADNSGQGNTSYMFNFTSTSSAQSPGKLGQAILFDGVDDLVSSGSSVSTDNLSPLTVSYWVKMSGYQTKIPVVSKGDNSLGGHGWYFGTAYNFGERMQFTHEGYATNLYRVTSANSLNIGEWTHYAVTWVGSDSVTGAKIYENGVEMSYSDQQDGSGGVQSDTGFGVIMGKNSGMGGSGFKGLLDDVRIYNRALSAGEVKRLYEQSAGTKQASTPLVGSGTSLNAGLIGHWTFDGPDIVNGSIIDLSGNGNHGAPKGIATSTFYVSGRLGQAVFFDATKANDIIRVPQSAMLNTIYNNGGGGMSVAFWYKPKVLSTATIIILGQGSDSEWDILSNSTGRVSVEITHDGGTPLNDRFEAQLIAGKWHHFLITWNGGSTSGTSVSLYRNGVKQTLSFGDSGVGNPVSNGSSEALLFGTSFDPNGEELSGTLDDMRIYQRVLSGEEAMQLYNMGR